LQLPQLKAKKTRDEMSEENGELRRQNEELRRLLRMATHYEDKHRAVADALTVENLRLREELSRLEDERLSHRTQLADSEKKLKVMSESALTEKERLAGELATLTKERSQLRENCAKLERDCLSFQELSSEMVERCKQLTIKLERLEQSRAAAGDGSCTFQSEEPSLVETELANVLFQDESTQTEMDCLADAPTLDDGDRETASDVMATLMAEIPTAVDEDDVRMVAGGEEVKESPECETVSVAAAAAERMSRQMSEDSGVSRGCLGDSGLQRSLNWPSEMAHADPTGSLTAWEELLAENDRLRCELVKLTAAAPGSSTTDNQRLRDELSGLEAERLSTAESHRTQLLADLEMQLRAATETASTEKERRAGELEVVIEDRSRLCEINGKLERDCLAFQELSSEMVERCDYLTVELERLRLQSRA